MCCYLIYWEIDIILFSNRNITVYHTLKKTTNPIAENTQHSLLEFERKEILKVDPRYCYNLQA